MRLFIILITLFVISSCVKEEKYVLPNQFTKEVRALLGAKIRAQIIADSSVQILPNASPYDVTIYYYLQTLYDQVTNRARLDRYAPSNNRWNPNRKWQIFVLGDNRKNIFVIPGGDLFITKGLLQSLRYESEIYYLLAYELCLMNDRHLLNQLIQRFGTNAIYNIALGKTPVSTIDLAGLTKMMFEFEFEGKVTKELDEMTAREICATSVMDRLAIVDILDYASTDNWEWLKYRKNYNDRRSYVHEIETASDCGNFITNGNYQTYVLGVLN